jgi:hypothetical protein
MFQIKTVEKIKTHFLFNVENYCTVGQATVDMVHAHYMLDTLRIQTLTQNRYFLSLYHRNNGCTNALHLGYPYTACLVICPAHATNSRYVRLSHYS